MSRVLAGLPAVFLVFACATQAAAPRPSWRDLNHNGRLDPYEDRRAPLDRRVENLLGQMTIEEKAAMLAHGNLPGIGSPFGASNEGYDLDAASSAILLRGVTSFITRLNVDPEVLARMNNAIQQIAEGGRLGIPVTISTDPRNQFQEVRGASTKANGFSLWPNPIGLAAIDDEQLVRRFGDIVRREYRATGIHMALSPQADLATNPRWPRIAATFGSDPQRVARLVGAEIEGLQGGRNGLQRHGVAAVVKHWIGYGTGPDGFDAHNAYGRKLVLTNAELARHVDAFKGAFRVKVAGVMPTYGILSGVSVDGEPVELVGAGFSRQVVGDLLRRDQRFGGLVVSDWGIVNDCPEACIAPTSDAPQTARAIGMPWGVERLSMPQRIGKALSAGVDQIGGLDEPRPILDAIRAGNVTPARLDDAVRHVLRVKFALGLFDYPYVDPDHTAKMVGTPAATRLANAAQRRSITRLSDKQESAPLKRGQRVWLFGLSEQAARAAGLVPVRDPAEASAAIIRMKTPSEALHPWHFFGSGQSEGRTDYRAGDPGYDALMARGRRIPAYVGIDMDRPAPIANLQDTRATLFAIFGSSDEAFFDVLKAPKLATGRLPFAVGN